MWKVYVCVGFVSNFNLLLPPFPLFYPNSHRTSSPLYSSPLLYFPVPSSLLVFSLILYYSSLPAYLRPFPYFSPLFLSLVSSLLYLISPLFLSLISLPFFSYHAERTVGLPKIYKGLKKHHNVLYERIWLDPCALMVSVVESQSLLKEELFFRAERAKEVVASDVKA